MWNESAKPKKEKQEGSITTTASEVKVLGYNSYQDDEETNFQVLFNFYYFCQIDELSRKTKWLFLLRTLPELTKQSFDVCSSGVYILWPGTHLYPLLCTCVSQGALATERTFVEWRQASFIVEDKKRMASGRWLSCSSLPLWGIKMFL